MRLLKFLSIISAGITFTMKILKVLSVITTSISLVLFIGHIWLCYIPNDKSRYARVSSPYVKG